MFPQPADGEHCYIIVCKGAINLCVCDSAQSQRSTRAQITGSVDDETHHVEVCLLKFMVFTFGVIVLVSESDPGSVLFCEL